MHDSICLVRQGTSIKGQSTAWFVLEIPIPAYTLGNPFAHLGKIQHPPSDIYVEMLI